MSRAAAILRERADEFARLATLEMGKLIEEARGEVLLSADILDYYAWQSRGLLIGEGIRPETARALRDRALAQPGVRDVEHVLSMYVGPDDVLVTMDLDFDAGTETSVAAIAMVEVERRIRLRFPMIKRLFIESGSSAVHQRWTRPGAIRTPAETLATPDSAGEATNAP